MAVPESGLLPHGGAIMPDGAFGRIRTLGPQPMGPRLASISVSQHRLEHEGEARRHMVCPIKTRSDACCGCDHQAVHFEDERCHRPCTLSHAACQPVEGGRQ